MATPRQVRGKHGLRRFWGLAPKAPSCGGRETASGAVVGQITTAEMYFSAGRLPENRSAAHPKGTCAMGGVKECATCKGNSKSRPRTKAGATPESKRFAGFAVAAPRTGAEATATAVSAASIVASGQWWKIFDGNVWVCSRRLPLGSSLPRERGELVFPDLVPTKPWELPKVWGA